MLLLLALLAQDADALVRALGAESPDERARAQRALVEAGEAVLPRLRDALHAASDPDLRARLTHAIATIEWGPYLPLGIEDDDPSILLRLAGGDDETSAAALEAVLRRSDGGTWAMERKALRDGTAGMRRLLFARMQGYDYGAGGIREVLAALDASSAGEFPGLARSVVLSVRPEHEARLREIGDPIGVLGLAALADAPSQEAALALLSAGPAWCRLAAIEAFGRTPFEPAGDRLRDCLTETDPDVVCGAAAALSAYPDVDVRDALVAMLSYRGEEWTVQQVQAAALHGLAARGIDESERIWSMIRDGTIAEEQSYLGTMRGPSPDSFAGRVAAALLVADDPALLDAETEELWWLFFEIRGALRDGATPRIEARLRRIAADEEEAHDSLKAFAAEYVEARAETTPRTPDEILAELERDPSSKAYPDLPNPNALSESQAASLTRLCQASIADAEHPLRTWAAVKLHQMNLDEGTRVLLEIAATGTYAAGSILYFYLQNEPRAVPIFQKNLESGDRMVRGEAVMALSRRLDEAVPPVALEMVRAGEFVWVKALDRYEDRDFTDALIEAAGEGTNRQVVQGIVEYVRRRGRRDRIGWVRERIGDTDSSVHDAVAATLAEWGDVGSFDRLADGARSGPVLLALGRLDADRTRPILLEMMKSRDYQVRSTAYAALRTLARPEDGRLLIRLLNTDGYAHWYIPEAAGRLRVAGAAEAILALRLYGSSARGLAYLGERRAVPLLMEDLEGYTAADHLAALEYIVRADRYPDLCVRKDLGSGTAPIAEALDRIGRAFGIAIGADDGLFPQTFTFQGEETLLEVLARQQSNTMPGYFAPVSIGGKVRLMKLDAAREHWRAWWADHAREFR